VLNIEPGSSLYYSLLWTDSVTKERFVQRLNLLQSLNGTLDDVQDPEVAQQKIHWWHEELERMINGSARHPATQACQKSTQRSNTNLSKGESNPIMFACLAIMSSVSDVRFTPPATMQDRDEQLVKNFTARLALLSHALSDDINDLDMTSHPAIAAEGLAKHEQLARLPALLHRGHAVFSDETYKTHNVTPSDLAADVRVAANSEPDDQTTVPVPASLAGIPVVEDKPGKKSLIKAAVEDTHAALLKATIHSEVNHRYRQEALLPLWRMIVLRRKQLALWEKKQPDLLREHMTLTPVSKLFHAWRNRR
jgi:hypothetical protein